MRGIGLWVVGGLVVVMLGVGVYFVAKPERAGAPQSGTISAGEAAEAGATKTACDVFTAAVAKEVLGDTAKKAELPSGGQVSTDDISVTTCLYDNGSEDIRELITASVLVRGAKNQSAYATNQFGYENTKESATNGANPAEIARLGDAAWFNPTLGQVNVFIDEGKYWLIVQAGEGAKGDRALSEKLARSVVENF